MNNINNCIAYNTLVGPTGPRGPSETIPGALKAFTIFVDYSAANAISRVYIPPFMFGVGADPSLPPGGVFTTNVGTDLVFLGNPTIVMAHTNYAFATSLSANGYITQGQWQIVPPANIRPQNGFLNYSITNDNSITIGADLQPINGANLAVKPTSGVAAGFLATITIFYM